MGERRFGNYNSCCRLCLSEKLGTLKPIFDDGAGSRDIVKNIQDCMGIEIQANDKLSTMMCEQCLSKINGWSHFRRICNENQEKLVNWMNSWTSSNIANMSIQIKDEVVEDGNERPAAQIPADDDDVVQVKAEPVDNTFEQESQEEDIYDLPPPLTPYPPENQDSENDNNELNDALATSTSFTDVNGESGMVNGEKINETSQSNDAKNCRICNKVFSSVGNRRKHENMIHRRKEKDKENTDQNKQTEASKPKTSLGSDSELQKIQFAAGLKLKQRSETSKEVPIENMPLSKVEISYLEKCKVIVKMADTLTCSCHQDKFGDVKDLFNHLKKQRTWFAMFTCYNCLITFGDRSSYMKHYYDCSKQLLQNLRRLSESPVNPEIKIRLYQSYKCIRCNCIFSFHEDFCSHFDQEHMEMPQSEPPYTCLCSKTFDEVDSYKQHLHISCFLRYFCDICFGVFPSTDAFKLHCENEHDTADGSTLESYDTFHKGRTIQEMQSVAGSSKRSLPADFKPTSNGDKRRCTINLPVLEPEDPDFVPEQNKVINPHAIRNTKSIDPQPCPFKNCGKWYSSYHNMLRHYKQAHDKSGKILQCSVCPLRFSIASTLKKHELTEHKLENSEAANPNRDQFKFSCPECGDLFKSLDEWKQHMEKHPKKTCFECGKQFTLQSELEQHRSTHLNIKVYRDAKTQNYKSTMVNSSLACEICDKNFDSKSELRQHKLLHEKMPVLSAHEDTVNEQKERSKKYSCHTCNKHYASYGGIWDHNKRHHSGQNIVYPRRCNQCNKILTSKGAWSNHQKMHERYLKAQQAKAAPPKSPELHNRSKHRVVKSNDDDESYHTCKRCFKVFSNKYNLKNHMKSHGISVNPNRSSSKTGKIIKTYWCDICHQACQGYADLQKHKKEEHHIEAIPKLANQVEPMEQKKPLIFNCSKCSQTFHTNFALKRHVEKHAEPDVKPKASIYCKHCKIPFYSVESLNTHMTAEHDHPAQSGKTVLSDKPKKFPCNVCKKVFDNTSALCSHLGWHKRGKFGKKVLKSQEKMVRSMLNQMPREQLQPKLQANYQCYTCSKTFFNETALQIHILEYHRNVNTTVLSCNSCKLSFETRASYDTHMQLHKVMENQTSNQKSKPAVNKPAANKPHKCRLCPSGFSRSDTLNAHVRQHHKEHYSDYYKCMQCDRVFEKQNSLTIHLKVHDRQKVTAVEVPKSAPPTKNMYFCSICDVGFALAKDLRYHVVKEHPF